MPHTILVDEDYNSEHNRKKNPWTYGIYKQVGVTDNKLNM